MTPPMIFCNASWMKFYRGDPKADPPKRGGKWVEENGWDFAMFNFLAFRGRYYGFVQAKNARLNLERLGAPRNADRMKGVLVVWVATSEDRGPVIVGWYKNATLYRDRQWRPVGTVRKYNTHPLSYYAQASVKDSRLLERHKRLFPIPRGKRRMGQYNVWYADQPYHSSFRDKVWHYIKRGKLPGVREPERRGGGQGKQPDVEKRRKVEQRAMLAAARYYSGLGYKVKRVDGEKLGWDLEAIGQGRKLLVEVKGVSGKAISVELTPREYTQMQGHRATYHLFVLTQALDGGRKAHYVFEYDESLKRWQDDRSGRWLHFDPLVAARATA